MTVKRVQPPVDTPQRSPEHISQKLIASPTDADHSDGYLQSDLGLSRRQHALLQIQQRQGNQAAQRFLAGIQRVAAVGWMRQSGSPATGDNAQAETVNADPANAAAGSTRRIPINGLTHGNVRNDASNDTGRKDNQGNLIQVHDRNEHVSDRTNEAAGNSQAIVVIPDNLRMNQSVEVLVHLHGQNVGYRQSGGSVRDIAVDEIEQQVRLSGRNMIGILPQGIYTSGANSFGNIDQNAYLQEVWDFLTANNLWTNPVPAPPPAAPPRGRLVLSAHSGGGFQLTAMLDADRLAAHNDPAQANPASAANSTGLGGVFLFDNIHNATQATQVINWVVLQMNHDYLRLSEIANNTADPAARQTAQLTYLAQSMRFRGYFSHTSNDYYARNYRPLLHALNAWFDSGTLRTPAVAWASFTTADVMTALHNNYQVVDVGHSNHDAILGRDHRLQQALGTLPTVGTPAAAVPQPATSGGSANSVAPNAGGGSMDGGTPNRSSDAPDAGVDENSYTLPGGVQRQERDGQDAGVADAPIAGAPHTEADAATADATSGADVNATPDSGAPQPAIAYTSQDLVEAILRESSTTHSTLMRPEYIRQRLDARQTNADLNAAFDQTLVTVPAGNSAQLQSGAQTVLQIVEHQWVLDPTTSSLDLLDPAQRDRYRNFAWNALDYPGHAQGEAAGPNESRAVEMNQALARLQGQRRPNSGDTAVVTESQFTSSAARRAYIIAQLRTVPTLAAQPGQPAPPSQSGQRINDTALAAFIRMRDAAHADGVQLIILSSYRTPAESQQRSSGQNPNAIAHYSSHNLGLAIDFQMSSSGQHYLEATTRPMQNVINMHQSPAHKWMFIHGPQFGWYPWHDEPWHWEYNPPGFRDQFEAAFQASLPSHRTVPPT